MYVSVNKLKGCYCPLVESVRNGKPDVAELWHLGDFLLFLYLHIVT